MDEKTGIFAREIEFHNDWAESTPVEDILVRECFESPLAQENRFALDLMGNLDGKTVLDVGTGLGEAATYFALQGAQVIATDLSPVMIERASQLALHYSTQIEGRVCPAEKLDLSDETVDICYAANVLHHVTDRRKALREMHRILRPNGLVVTWDPLAYNPVINVYRRMATKVRTADEKPLGFSIIQEYQEFFDNVGHREFWLTSLAIFLKYYLIDGIHPNKDRYWKRILREGPVSTNRLAPFLALDRFLLRCQPFKALAWTILMYGQKKA